MLRLQTNNEGFVVSLLSSTAGREANVEFCKPFAIVVHCLSLRQRSLRAPSERPHEHARALG